MILSLRDLDLRQLPRPQVCIVGSGAAGITLACELDGSGISVLLLDPGLAKPGTSPSQSPYIGTSDEPHALPSHFRRRGYGGTTGIWGGRCVPYDPIDFEVREHVPNSGWPVAYDEIAQYYPRAMNYLDAGAHKFSAIDIFDDHRPTFPGVFDDGDIITDAVERYSLPTDFGRRYGQRLEHSKNVMVLGGVQLLRLNRDSGSGNITGLACALSDGKTPFTLEADQVIMAVGGIETPRILLASDPDRGGIGNDLGLVGRYYTCHVEKIHGLVRSKKPGLVFDFEKTRDGVYARRKILIKESVQRQHKLMNISFRLHYPDISQPEHRSSVLSAVYLAKRTLIPEYRRILQHSSDDAPMPSMEAHLRNVALGMPELMGFGVKWLRERVLAERKLPYVLVPNADQSFPIEFNAEQIPLWDSRVLLGDKLDEFGVPQVHVHWQMCEQDIDSICRSYRILRDALNATGACSVEFDDERLFDDLSRSFPVGGHHVGTTRMGASSEHGVVNGDCQVFGVPNLYIASSSVFPTSSHANPTLTIVALSLRLAGFLKHKLTH